MTRTGAFIALVDDEAPVRIMLDRVLRMADYRVGAFSTGEDFLASLARQRPVCAILDIHLPGLSGLEVRSRMNAAQIDIPVVFITASDDAALDRRALEAGGVVLLRKPFSSDELLGVIGSALESTNQGD